MEVMEERCPPRGPVDFPLAWLGERERKRGRVSNVRIICIRGRIAIVTVDVGAMRLILVLVGRERGNEGGNNARKLRARCTRPLPSACGVLT